MNDVFFKKKKKTSRVEKLDCIYLMSANISETFKSIYYIVNIKYTKDIVQTAIK